MTEKIQDSSIFYEKYQIQSQIGRGASGVCYKIKKISDGKTYALKKISSNSIKKNNIKGAYNEVTILSSLEHPNIIKYHESFMDSQQLYIVMQYASKGDLHTILKKRKIKQQFYEQNELWSMIRQLLNALQYLHNKNIIHRDVKTLNIFVDDRNKVVIGDLGVSKILKSDLGLYSRVGTPLYLAPQIIKYQKYDFKADVWGLGCVSYLLATLSHPFQGKNIIVLGQNIVNTDPRPIQKYSQNLRRLIFDMLQKNHNKRLTPTILLKKYFSGLQEIKMQLKQQVEKKPLQNCLIEANIQKLNEKQKQIKKSSDKFYQRRYLTTKKNQKQLEIFSLNENKIQIKGSQNFKYQKKLGFVVGNFIGQSEQFKKEKIQVPLNSNKTFQNTIAIKPNKIAKQEEQDFGNGNQQVTKCQKQSNQGKKTFQSHHNLRIKQASFLIKNDSSEKKFQFYPSIQRIQTIASKSTFQKIKQNNLVQSAQCFKPFIQPQIYLSSQPQQENKNPISIRKIATEARCNIQSENLRSSKQYSIIEKNSKQRKSFVRNSQQIYPFDEQRNQNNKNTFIDVFKIANDTFFKGQKQESQGIGRYRQRPKSSIGKKQKISQSSAIKPRRKQNTYNNFYSLIQTKFLKKPEVIVL